MGSSCKSLPSTQSIWTSHWSLPIQALVAVPSPHGIHRLLPWTKSRSDSQHSWGGMDVVLQFQVVNRPSRFDKETVCRVNEFHWDYSITGYCTSEFSGRGDFTGPLSICWSTGEAERDWSLALKPLYMPPGPLPLPRVPSFRATRALHHETSVKCNFGIETFLVPITTTLIWYVSQCYTCLLVRIPNLVIRLPPGVWHSRNCMEESDWHDGMQRVRACLRPTILQGGSPCVRCWDDRTLGVDWGRSPTSHRDVLHVCLWDHTVCPMCLWGARSLWSWWNLPPRNWEYAPRWELRGHGRILACKLQAEIHRLAQDLILYCNSRASQLSGAPNT